MNENDVPLKEHIETQLEQYKVAHGKEHELLAESVQHTRENLELRLESMNEFRKQILEERGTFLPRDRFNQKIEEIEKTLKNHEERSNERIGALEVQLSNLSGRVAAIGSAITIGLIILELLLRFLIK